MLRRPLAALVLAGATAVAFAASTALLSQEAPEPSPQHNRLVQSAGVFEGRLTSYVMGPEPVEMKARETIEAIGPFWTQSFFLCDFMGQPYTGCGSFGYDAERGKYLGTWIDSMSPLLAIMEGERNADGQIEMHWMGPDESGAMVPHRSVTEHRKDGYTSTFYMGAGEGTKSMMIEMKQRPAKPAADKPKPAKSERDGERQDG
jgi:hypothetical protein